MSLWIPILLLLFILALGASIFELLALRKARTYLTKRESDLEAKIYEIAILKELGERIGYSLNTRKIVEIITGSLGQFIDYSAVSYLLIEPQLLLFHCNLESSVDATFVSTIRDRMRAALNALTNDEYIKFRIEETVTGAIITESLHQPVRSFFNIPLVIRNRTVGIITVASTKSDLYHEDEMTLLYKITSQASQAVSRLEEVLAVEEEKLNAMVASMPDGLLMTDPEFRIVVINPALQRTLGLEGNSTVSIFNIIDCLGGVLDIRGKLDEAINLDKLIVAENVSFRQKTYQVLISPVKPLAPSDIPGKQNTFGSVALFHDITHERELEKMREDFTSMMVHELRSPLDGICKITELLTSKQRKGKSYHEFTHMIHQSASEMLTLVSTLLDIAKIDAGKFEILPVVSNTRTLLEEKLKFYRPLAADRHIQMSDSLDPALPDILLDPHRIGQVINNLLSNAIKFSPVAGTIHVSAFRHASGGNINQEGKTADPLWHAISTPLPLTDALVVAVSDMGIGITHDEIPQLFTKFQRLSAGKLSQKGTGLGLVIARGIIEAHHGIMTLGSTESKGTTFVFTIPLSH
ncbi:MAG: ATP-binding protein [Patescibacteria group bacterium]